LILLLEAWSAKRTLVRFAQTTDFDDHVMHYFYIAMLIRKKIFKKHLS